MNPHEIFVQNKFKEVSKLINPNSKILDIGCNDCSIINFLKQPIYYGVDGDKEIINKSKERNIRVECIDLNKEKLPFENIKFDYILMLDILEHIVNPSNLIKNSIDRLDNNGEIIITLPNDYHLLNKIRFLFNKHLTENPFAQYGHLHYFPIKSGEQFLKKNGLKIIKKIILSPTKPAFFPDIIKDTLAKLLPQSFARDILYLTEPIS